MGKQGLRKPLPVINILQALSFSKTMKILFFASHLMDPDVTRNGRGVGQGEAGVLLTELLVLDRVLCGHCGGPANVPGFVSVPCLQHSDHWDTGFPFIPKKQN
jgi:hypothetical protein